MGFGRMLFVLLYSFVPLIVIPIIAYHFNNWYLLFGILFCYLGVAIASYKRYLFFFALLFCLGVWTNNGFSVYSYTTIFFLCFLEGYVSYLVVLAYNNKEIRKNNIEDYSIMARNEIIINAKIEEYKIANPGVLITEAIKDKIEMQLFIDKKMEKFPRI